jgi:hypothetical protein
MDQNGMQDRIIVATLFSGGTLDSSNSYPGGIAPESSTEASIYNTILPTDTTEGTLESSNPPGGIAPESSTEASIGSKILPNNTLDGTAESLVEESTVESLLKDATVVTHKNTRKRGVMSPKRQKREKEHHVAPRLSNQPKESIVIPLHRYNAVCAGCGLLTSYAYCCKFCDAALHIFCSIDPEELGHGVHYTCPKCRDMRKDTLDSPANNPRLQKRQAI